MGGSLLYPHSVLQFPSFSTFTKPKFAKPIFSPKEIGDNRPFVSSIRADGTRRERPQSGKGPEDNPQSFDGRSTVSSNNKEEILALFKRIQSSISKGDRDNNYTVNSKKRTPKPASDDNKPSAESILEVLRQSRTQVKGKKTDKLVATHSDSVKKEKEIVEDSLVMGLNSKRAPSSFTRRSPIPPVISPIEKVEMKSEILSEKDDEKEEQSKKFEGMKLAELKEVAKSKGIKGYSKLKKSELVELLIRS